MQQKLVGPSSVMDWVAQIVAAHLSNNAVPTADVPGFIRAVHSTVVDLENISKADRPASAGTANASASGSFHFADIQTSGANVHPDASGKIHVPAVPIEDSIHPEYIVCLEDGRRLRMLKRYLMTQYGMTPDQYRAKWSLPRNYPMAAPAVIEQRRQHAKTAGLGRKVLQA